MMPRHLKRRSNNGAMAEMDAIEIAHGHHGPLGAL
jgi:hypothetical protein